MTSSFPDARRPSGGRTGDRGLRHAARRPACPDPGHRGRRRGRGQRSAGARAAGACAGRLPRCGGGAAAVLERLAFAHKYREPPEATFVVRGGSRNSARASVDRGRTHGRRHWDRKKTAEAPKTAWEGQPVPFSPMKSRRFRTCKRSTNISKSREKTGVRGRLFSLVPGCSRHAGPQRTAGSPAGVPGCGAHGIRSETG